MSRAAGWKKLFLSAAVVNQCSRNFGLQGGRLAQLCRDRGEGEQRGNTGWQPEQPGRLGPLEAWTRMAVCNAVGTYP